MRPYSVDLRERVLPDYDAGLGTEAVARRSRVSPQWVRDLRRLRAETGQIAPRPGLAGPQPKLADCAEQLAALVREQPDATLKELQQRLPVRAGVSPIWRALKALGLTLKKSPARGGTAAAGCAGPARGLAVLAGSFGRSAAGVSR